MAAHEEHGKRDDLETRAFGLTSMVFAMAILGIYVSYATAAAVLRDHDVPFYRWLAWAPWLFGASVITTAIWRLRAKALGIPRRPVGLQVTVLYKALFLAALISITFLSPTEQGWAHRTVAVGMFLLALAHVHDIRFRGRITMVPHFLAGFATVAVALALTYLTPHLAEPFLALLHGLTVATALFLAGLYTYFRGTRRSETGAPVQGPLDEHTPA